MFGLRRRIAVRTSCARPGSGSSSSKGKGRSTCTPSPDYDDKQTVERMGQVVEEADERFPGLIVQQWGYEWHWTDDPEFL